MARRDIKYARKSQIGGTGSTTLNNFQDNGLSGEVLYNSGAVLASSATGVDITGDVDVTGDSTLGGNVGIGTSSPASTLDVWGEVLITDTNAGDEPSLKLRNLAVTAESGTSLIFGSGSVNAASIIARRGSGSTQGYLSFESLHLGDHHYP